MIAVDLEPESPSLTNYTELRERSDEELIGALGGGENEALTVLFSRHRAMVFRVAMKILRDVGEAEDLTQRVFFEVFRSSTRFHRSKGNAKSWILTMAYSRSVNRRQSLQRKNFYQWESFDDAAHSLYIRQESQAARLERGDLLLRGLGRLSTCQRKIIRRVCFEGWTLREIAGETGDSFANVRHRYYRGLKKMRALISDPNI